MNATVTHPNLHVVAHPLVDHLLAQARDRQTPPAEFRRLLSRIGALLGYEAVRTAPRQRRQVVTPLETMEVDALKLPLTIVPILRAGLGLADGILELLPEARMGHIGLFRDEQTLKPTTYYENLPADIETGTVLLVDPMLATGGSSAAALNKLAARGCRDIRFVCLVAAPEGVSRLAQDAPQVPIFTAALDRQLNEVGYILPGLGDAGDRLYGTGM
jgi:uracil phosphoribosyltransferase